MSDLQLHLLRYGEIGTKSLNIRKHFEDILIQNVKRLFLSEGEEVIVERKGRGRIFVHIREENSHLLSRVFGLVSYSPAEELEADIEDLKEKAVDFSNEISGSFAIRARRTGTHNFDSQDVERELGRVVLENHPDLEVDLNKPDHEFHVEIRHNTAYVFTEIDEGPGGLPLSSQGKVASYMEDRNDFVATWLMMKRGARPYVYTPGTDWSERLEPWDPNLKKIKVSDLKETLDLKFPKEVEALVVGETLQDISQIDHDGLLLRPLIGFTEQRIERTLKRIDSFVVDVDNHDL